MGTLSEISSILTKMSHMKQIFDSFNHLQVLNYVLLPEVRNSESRLLEKSREQPETYYKANSLKRLYAN